MLFGVVVGGCVAVFAAQCCHDNLVAHIGVGIVNAQAHARQNDRRAVLVYETNELLRRCLTERNVKHINLL